MFQDHRLLPWRTVAQNIELVLASAGIQPEQWPDRIGRYLRMLQISDYRDSWPMRLSGGQRQRVSIARALAIDPAVVLMDEPFSMLDEVTARVTRQQLVELWQESGTAIVFVTHSIREAVFLADRIVILTRGPASVLEDVTVPIERPRRYEDPQLTEFESRIVERVMSEWVLARQVTPALFAAARTSFAFAWKIVVLVEALSQPEGVGAAIYTAFRLLDAAEMIALALIFIVLMRVVDAVVFGTLERRMLAWAR